MSYTIKELSSELNVTEKTCHRWIANGLKTVEGSKKPILIMGTDVKDFLRNKNLKRKVILQKDQFYCFTCKAPRSAKRGSNCKLKNKKIGICRDCNGKMSRTI